MKTFLVAGFRRFGGYAENSAELAVRELAKSGRLSGFEIATETLPTEIGLDFGYGLFESALYRHVDGIIMLGMASDKHGLSIETHASNRLGHPKYHPTADPVGLPIDAGMPLGKKCHLDLGFWEIERSFRACWAAGIKVEISVDAGGFCCNHLMFRMWQLQRANKRYQRIPWIFIHIPCARESIAPQFREEFDRSGKLTMKTGDVIRGLEIMLRTLTA